MSILERQWEDLAGGVKDLYAAYAEAMREVNRLRDEIKDLKGQIHDLELERDCQ